MGLFDWLQKSGPGSPGSTAKAIAKLFRSLPKDTKYQDVMPGYIDKYYGLAEIVEMRKLAERQLGSLSLLSKYDTQELVRRSMGDMNLLVFQIMYLETGQFRASLTSDEMVKSTLSTIKSVLDEMLPERKDIDTFGSNFTSAVAFMYANKPL
jgi:hypothetical protein